MASPAPIPDKHAGLTVNVTGLGRVRLIQALATNPETTLYQTDHPGVVVKVFDLGCGKPDEIGYGPYMNFQSELANFDEIHRAEGLRDYVPAYFGANIDYQAKYAFIAMEFLQGQNLRSWAEEAAARGYGLEALDDLRRATHEVLAILDLFHRCGFVMIDFKPDNIIRLDDGSVRLVDLGAFFTPRHQTSLASFVYTATPDHAEVLIDASNLQAGVPPTPASDVFSAGVALFEMATGDSRLVLNAKTAEEMLQTPSVYRFRDSQIADVWRAFPHLRDSLPLVRSQLQERRLLFSEVWHLLKAYLNAKVPDWESLPPAQQEQLLLTTGTTFILEQLPPPSPGWRAPSPGRPCSAACARAACPTWSKCSATRRPNTLWRTSASTTAWSSSCADWNSNLNSCRASTSGMCGWTAGPDIGPSRRPSRLANSRPTPSSFTCAAAATMKRGIPTGTPWTKRRPTSWRASGPASRTCAAITKPGWAPPCAPLSVSPPG
jgi:serine/threonine protein kinase